MPRRLRYQVAVSLDGFIARKDGSYDWIIMDPAIDFAAMYREFDAAVMGRKTFEVVGTGDTQWLPKNAVVFSRTLAPVTRSSLRITNEDPVDVLKAMKKARGRDIWLYGGGELFRTLLAAKLVDTVEVAVIPVLLGDGIPLLPPGVETKLTLCDHRAIPSSGIVALAYQVAGGRGPAPTIRYIKGAKVKR